jgi:hypothetical protein
MARISYGSTLQTSFADGTFSFASARTAPVTADLSTAIADVATLAALVVTAKVDVAASETEALACQTANVAVTPVENAIALLESDGASPTQGHVDALRVVWDTLSTACTDHNMAANSSANAATTAKTSTDLIDTAAVSSDLSGIAAADAADVVLDINAAVITTQNAVRAAVRSILARVAGGGAF